MASAGAAPAAHPVGDVAGLAADVFLADAIEDVAVGLAAEAGEAGLLGQGHLGVAGVAEDEDVEVAAHARLGDRGVHGAQAGEDAGGVLVVHRHQDGGSGVQLGHRALAIDAQRILGLAQQDREAGHSGAEPQRQGQEQRGQQHHDHRFQTGHAA